MRSARHHDVAGVVFCFKSLTFMPNCSATARWIDSMVILHLHVNELLEHCWVVSSVISVRFRLNQATRRVKSSFKFAHVGADAFEAMNRATRWAAELIVLSFLLKNGRPCFEIGRLNVGDEAPFETRTKAVFNFGSSFGVTTMPRIDDLLRWLLIA